MPIAVLSKQGLSSRRDCQRIQTFEPSTGLQLHLTIEGYLAEEKAEYERFLVESDAGKRQCKFI